MKHQDFQDQTVSILEHCVRKELERLALLERSKALKVTNWLIECYATQNHFSIWSTEVLQKNVGEILADPDYRDFLLNLQAVFAVRWSPLMSDHLKYEESFSDAKPLLQMVLAHTNEWGGNYDNSMLNEEISSQLVTNLEWITQVLHSNHWYLVFVLLILHVDVLELARTLSYLKPEPKQE